MIFFNFESIDEELHAVLGHSVNSFLYQNIFNKKNSNITSDCNGIRVNLLSP